MLLLCGCLARPTYGISAPRDDVRSYSRLLDFADSILGMDGALDKRGEERLDALIDLHVKFCSDVLKKPVPSQKVVLVKQGLRLFLNRIPERYSGSKREVTLRLIQDLVTNRAIFVELLTSDSTSEAIEMQLMAYLTRNQAMSYKEPVAIGSQVSVAATETPLRIVLEGIRLVRDEGTHGHYNRAVDAGETITLNIPLKNHSPEAYRSTSGFLQSKSPYVKSAVNEVIYSEQRVVDGETVVFGPGTAITPGQNYTFSISPLCPDGHEIAFELLVMDSDHRGQDFTVPFRVKVFNVGPLDFGKAIIDDDMPGLSDGDEDGKMEPGETIEYVLALKNEGGVRIESITATLFTDSDVVRFETGYDQLQYKIVEANNERPIPASFVFSLSEDSSPMPQRITMRLMTHGEARDRSYSWIRVNVHESGGVPLQAGTPKSIDLGGGVNMQFVWIPSGSFQMGSPREPDERPVHNVTLTKGFWMGKYEVTQEEYQHLMGSNPSPFKGDKNPVEKVSWQDAKAFCEALEAKTGKTLRLPTEAEWEYACRAGTSTLFYTGQTEGDLFKAGWCDDNSGRQSHPVGQKAPNAWGLYDMHGNVEELCEDWYGEDYYRDSPGIDPRGPASGTMRVSRGGGWFSSAYHGCRSASRYRIPEDYRVKTYGFRCVLPAEQ